MTSISHKPGWEVNNKSRMTPLCFDMNRHMTVHVFLFDVYEKPETGVKAENKMENHSPDITYMVD